jgi:hypothetical protein
MLVAFENLVAHAHQHRSTCTLTQGANTSQKFFPSPMARITISIWLHDFFLHDFTLTQLQKFITIFQIYLIIFGLMQFGIDDRWPHLCWRLAESDITVTPSVICMDWVLRQYYHMTYLVFSWTAMTFLTNKLEK